MSWAIKRTDTFLESLACIRDNKEALVELGKKLKRLQEDHSIQEGGFPARCTVKRPPGLRNGTG